MNHKVLLADDSLTIQKVIKITLANQPFDIVECSSDDELFKKLPDVNPAIVLLDFNLSEKFSGYELAAKIKAAVPNAQVLLLLGTFDTIDDAAMEKSGAADKIVKPFDSNKFISICKRLVDNSPVEEIKYPEAKKEKFVVPVLENDQWQVNHPAETPKVKEEPKANFNVKNHLNPLDHEVSDWGMSVPGVIDGPSHDKVIDLPPVMNQVQSLSDHKNKLDAVAPVGDAKFPDNNDLDYPTIEELNSQAKPVAEEKPKPKSKLISIESFNEPEEFQIEQGYSQDTESNVSSIEAQIRDEVEEDLWKVDEFEDLKKEVASKIEEVKNNFQPSVKDFDESLFKPLDENEDIKWTTSDNFSADDNADKSFNSGASSHNFAPQVSQEEVEALVKKYVKEYMDEMFAQKVEKIAWEVIPDLAENLIRQEMTKISHKILNESN